MQDDIPSQEEQDTVARYVLKRPLVRPNTSYAKAVGCIFIFVIINGVFAFGIIHMLTLPSISVHFSQSIQDVFQHHSILTSILICVMQYIIGGIIAARRAAIGAIRLYQRYAPEGIRRKCLFQPTCSEYAILSIQKYGLVRSCPKIYDRLFKRCKGRIYRVDEP